MKPLIRISSLLIILLCHYQRAGAQTLSGFNGVYFCGMTADSLNLNETGYMSGDSVIIYFGDGTSDTIAPVYAYSGSAYYGGSHFYTSLGTYTQEAVLLRSGARIDSVTTVCNYVPCTFVGIQLYNDVNSDCIYDAGDWGWLPSSAEVEIDSAGTPLDTQWVNSFLWYQAYGPSGTIYTFKVITDPHGFATSCPTSGSVSVTTGSSYYTYVEDTIGFACSPTACVDNAVYGYTDLAVHNGDIDAFVTSSSCTSTTATLDITISPKYSIVSTSGAPASISGNVVTFTFSSLSDVNCGYANVQLLPVGTLAFGDTAHTTFKLYPYSGDCDTTNNYIATIDTIRSSWDPNYKSVSPEGNIKAGTNLQYTIGFENTGNDTAHNIHILDTLSDNVDVKSIKLISSSVQCAMTPLTYSGHNIVKFDFPNINLLDSTHHGKCTGMVVFSINSKSTLAPGTKIDNQAGIYFDDNAVVMTTPVENVIRSTLGINTVKNTTVNVYPNPVSDKLNISAYASQFSTYTVYNTVGQSVLTADITNNLTQVNVSSLPTGIYYLTLRGESGIKVVKFEKE